MEVSKLRGDLAHCWLAETLVQVLERAATQRQLQTHVLVSLGDAAIAAQGNVLSVLVKGFLRRSEVCNAAGEGSYAHVNDADELQSWISDRALNTTSSSSTGVVFMVYAPSEDAVAAQQVDTIIQAVIQLQGSLGRIVVLVVHNPDGILGLEAESRAMDSALMYHLQYVGEQTEGEWRRSLKFIAEPLNVLRDQCGWRFVMEIVRWVPDSAGALANGNETFGAARATMFSSINQLPFQLLLLALRWSHFHPELVRACAKKLRRQTLLIPQARVRRELAELEKREVQLWSGLYPPVDMGEDKTSNRLSKQEQTASTLFTDTSFQPQVVPRKLERLSKCCLWDTQKQFYKDQGIRAWSSGAIPFGVSSSSFLAAGYARTAVDFLLSNADCIQASFKGNGPPNCFVWEAASGSCKFLHSFMLHFTELVEANDEFKRRGLVPLVIATDLSDQVLSSRRQMECFHSFIERRQLDFALFDTHDFVHGGSTKRKTLELVHAKRQWHVGSDGPVALMGNYFLDSLRADIFTVAIQQTDPPSEAVNVPEGSSTERVVVQTALLDSDTCSLAGMDVSLRPIPDPRTQAVYGDNRLNDTLVQVLDQFRSGASSSAVKPVSSTGLVLFPVEAFEFFLTLVDRDDDIAGFPVAVLAGDARFSFRDPISGAFITTNTTEGACNESGDVSESVTTEKVSLELPQLSPHPDCFCLPVDFEIFKMFFQSLNNNAADISTSAQVISAPASDTFDIFFATVEPRAARRKATPTTTANALQTSFQHRFARFTPGDCDLLWGTMSFDDGARCFSADTLLALLAQTGWDFDLFVVFHWELLNRLRLQEVDTESEHYQQLLIEAGIKSWRTFYHMEQQSETDATTRGVRLQLARWFYELEAYESVLEVLTPWRDEAHNDINSADIGVFYLLGLTSLRMDEYWTALSFFRLCARLAPTKLKFQRQVARTLLALQTLRSSSNSSNESDGN
ncbi:uncharacterized protein KRP23_10759 [Phytophthora ramorum]|uniref:uncharacterized protein n=1 Tax=Phytophthora ramorum TaxID=164328 RepID=UPI0030B60356|nr:hypothetical protein KRP23_10759 [Phytophthora ramorum]